MNPSRKRTRLKDYDYGAPGAYFVTICTWQKEKILSQILVGEGLCALPQVILTDTGRLVDRAIRYLMEEETDFVVDRHVIMPNHVHLMIRVEDKGGRGGPPLQDIIHRIKSYTTHQYGGKLWQRSFHDHVVRNEQDYLEILKYIEHNPAKWLEDTYYTE